MMNLCAASVMLFGVPYQNRLEKINKLLTHFTGFQCALVWRVT
jgi:hypothetical protein